MTDGVIGRRVYANEYGYLPDEINHPSSYGKATAPRLQNTRLTWWQVTTPDGGVCSLNPDIHTVDEHPDGTITVTPSIDLSYRKNGGWHGHLTKGVFTAVKP